MILYDGIIPQQNIIQIMKNALSEMEHPRVVNAIGKVTTAYGFVPQVNVVTVIDDENSEVTSHQIVNCSGIKRKL
jgi:hypothetical protein